MDSELPVGLPSRVFTVGAHSLPVATHRLAPDADAATVPSAGEVQERISEAFGATRPTGN